MNMIGLSQIDIFLSGVTYMWDLFEAIACEIANRHWAFKQRMAVRRKIVASYIKTGIDQLISWFRNRR